VTVGQSINIMITGPDTEVVNKRVIILFILALRVNKAPLYIYNRIVSLHRCNFHQLKTVDGICIIKFYYKAMFQ